MKALDRLRVERAMQHPKPNSALLWLEAGDESERELRQVWAGRLEQPATTIMLALANLGDSPADVQEFRRAIPPQYDIAREDDQDLLKLRGDLRQFWNELAKERSHFGPTGEIGDNAEVAAILQRWWRHYDLDSDGWMIFWGTGSLFPTQKNFRGVIARILYHKRRYLAICPSCNQYFIKRRDDQKNCLAVTCQRKANNLRQQKFQSKERARKGGKRAHK